MRPNRPLSVLTACAVGSVGLLVVGLGSFLDVSKAEAASPSPIVAVTDTVIRGQLEDPRGDRVDNYEVQAIPVGSSTPAASAISYGSRFALFVPAGTYRLVGADLDRPVRYAPLSRARTVTVETGDVRRVGVLDLVWTAPIVTRAPSISGTAKVGGKLSAETGAWSRAGLHHEVVWLRGTLEVARGLTYRPTFRDAGGALTVQVSATAPGTAAGHATSAPLRVASVRLTATLKRRGAAVVVKVRARGASSLPVRIWQGKKVVARAIATPRATVRIPLRSARVWTLGPADGTKADRLRLRLR